jgi:hypothetical protein
MKNIWRGVCLAVFLAGVISFSQKSANRSAVQNQAGIAAIDDIEPIRPFVAKYVDYRVTPDGKRTIIGRRARYVKANGEWRVVAEGPKSEQVSAEGSNQSVVYGGDSDGVYARGRESESRRYVSPAADEKMLLFFRSHHSLKNNPEFVRTDEIAGVKVYVLRTEIRDPANPQDWVEESYSPKTGFNPLRTIIHLNDGSEFRMEAVSIEFRDVPENLNDDLKALPLKQKDAQKQ